MVTKEQLLERRDQLDKDLEAQHNAARDAQKQIQDGQARLAGCRDMINALSGAKQDVEHWLATFPVPEPPKSAAAAEVAQAPAPEAAPKRPIN